MEEIDNCGYSKREKESNQKKKSKERGKREYLKQRFRATVAATKARKLGVRAHLASKLYFLGLTIKKGCVLSL